MSGPRSSRISNCGLSLAWPSVRWKASGRPSRSTLRWIPAYAGTSLGREAPARAAQRLILLPPMAPAAETCARTTVESNIWIRCAVWLIAARASKKASNTPAWLKRQKRFHTEFQFPHSAGRARQVMLGTQKSCTASRKIRSFRPLAPRRERQARNTSSTVAQSSSVIRVSMVGSSQTDLPSVTDPRTWESTHYILSPIRPHGLGPEPEHPLQPYLTVSNLTVEGLLKTLAYAPAALGVFTAEGGQVTGGHGMAEERRLETAGIYSELWDGKAVKRLRALDGATVLGGRRLSAHLMIQPGAAATFLADELLRDQGLLSRLLVAAPDSIAGTRLFRETAPDDEAAIKAYGARILSV